MKRCKHILSALALQPQGTRAEEVVNSRKGGVHTALCMVVSSVLHANLKTLLVEAPKHGCDFFIRRSQRNIRH
ncbi:hypothetical protein GCM10007857_85870 [Bradyrhizobium iriomotense]|uniref:Secreted protein n=1 Tax=Bradyrhizobium iriomotense TaxID=441950 RepID=A0ABQ6BBV8_9BRAD|nr:hypothetical protein GCM10007857_85870 [Bradyrhizobium iriomotense]